MNSIVWKRALQVAALGVVVLLSACQSRGFAPQPNTGLQPNVGPAQMTVQRPRGLMAGERFLPCNGVMTTPLVEGTPLPFYTPRARSVGSFSPSPSTAYLYIADEYNSQIDIFPLKGQNQPQVGTITARIYLPYGLWFDRGTQSLYVANQSNNTVTVYPYGSTQPSLTYSQDLNRPLFPMVDRSGDLFVSNANDGTVVEYLAGSTSVHEVLQTPGVEADGMAFDHHGNLYVAYRTCPSGAGSIEKFAPGSTHGHVIGMALSDPQGVSVDSHDNVVVDETGTANNRLHQIDVFPPGSKTASLVVQMPNGDLPIELVIDCEDGHFYVASLYAGTVLGAKYPLPGQTLFVKDQVSAIVQGIAITKTHDF
jgi:DNA-binding beta-propeller fold protein YncE